MTRESLAQGNGKRVGKVLADRSGYADVYRTITAGPSGQRKDLLIARVRYVELGSYELEIINVSPGSTERGQVAGYAKRTDIFDQAKHPGLTWSITSYYDDLGEYTWLGRASSLALGCDVLINGVHAATGRHDSRRISGGTWKPKSEEAQSSCTK